MDKNAPPPPPPARLLFVLWYLLRFHCSLDMEKNAFPHAMLFIVGCVMVRTDKTEYMVMQVRGWGQELLVILSPEK